MRLRTQWAGRIKERLQEAEGVPTECQRFYLHGKELDDDLALAEYNGALERKNHVVVDCQRCWPESDRTMNQSRPSNLSIWSMGQMLSILCPLFCIMMMAVTLDMRARRQHLDGDGWLAMSGVGSSSSSSELERRGEEVFIHHA